MYGKKPRSPVCPCLILCPQEYFWLVPMFWCCPSCWRGDSANICSLFAKGEHPSAPEIVVLPLPVRMSQGRKRLVQGSHDCYGLPKHIQQLSSSQRAPLRLSHRAKQRRGKPEELWILPCEFLSVDLFIFWWLTPLQEDSIGNMGTPGNDK